jgi:hypothetical protein
MAGLLNLNWNAIVKAGYHALFERITNKYGLEPSQLSFEALKSFTVKSEDLGIIYSD